jgi:hypothetical protein
MLKSLFVIFILINVIAIILLNSLIYNHFNNEHDWSSIKDSTVLHKYTAEFIKKSTIKYKTTTYNPIKLTRRVVFSTTAIPPIFSQMLINYTTKTILNIPKKYKFFDYERLPDIPNNVVINSNTIDYGPATKILGLCELSFNEDTNIIYFDSDIKYDEDKLLSMVNYYNPNYIFGNSGGFYVDWPSNFSSMGLDLIEWAFKLDKNKFTISELLYGSGAILIDNIILNKVCHEINQSNFLNCLSCFFVDDEWLSFIYKKLGYKLISTRKNHPIIDVSLSDKNQYSNRLDYKIYKDNCLPCLQTEASPNNTIKVETILSISDDLHPSTEFTGLKEFVRLQYKFCAKYNIPYKCHESISVEFKHWSKIEILRGFLNDCDENSAIFYTDVDFLFLNNKFPKFKKGKSLILARGCDIDNEHLMVGNIIMKCDKELHNLLDVWIAASRIIRSFGELNDDQVAFNLIKPRFMHKIQISQFMIYDTCYMKYFKTSIIGIHFPGRNKLQRLMEWNK